MFCMILYRVWLLIDIGKMVLKSGVVLNLQYFILTILCKFASLTILY